MSNRYKNIFKASGIILLGVVIVFLVLTSRNSFSEEQELSADPVVVAVCPAFSGLVDASEKEVKIIKTQSTAESLDLLEQGAVNFVISGRALKPGEPKYSVKNLGHGYDFLFHEEIFISEKEMEFITFYTNLSTEKINNDFGYILKKNLIEVENPYEYLDKGVVITLVEDFMIGAPAHILAENGSRLAFSRLPRLYYSGDYSEEKLNFILALAQQNEVN